MRKARAEAVHAFKPFSVPKLCQKALLEQQVKRAKAATEGNSTLSIESQSLKRPGQRAESAPAVPTKKSKPSATVTSQTVGKHINSTATTGETTVSANAIVAKPTAQVVAIDTGFENKTQLTLAEYITSFTDDLSIVAEDLYLSDPDSDNESAAVVPSVNLDLLSNDLSAPDPIDVNAYKQVDAPQPIEVDASKPVETAEQVETAEHVDTVETAKQANTPELIAIVNPTGAIPQVRTNTRLGPDFFKELAKPTGAKRVAIAQAVKVDKARREQRPFELPFIQAPPRRPPSPTFARFNPGLVYPSNTANTVIHPAGVQNITIINQYGRQRGPSQPQPEQSNVTSMSRGQRKRYHKKLKEMSTNVEQ